MEGRNVGICSMVLKIRWALQSDVELFKSTLGSLLTDEAQDFVFLTTASDGSGTVTKPTFGNLYQTTQLVVTSETVLSIFFLVHFGGYSVIIQN